MHTCYKTKASKTQFVNIFKPFESVITSNCFEIDSSGTMQNVNIIEELNFSRIEIGLEWEGVLIIICMKTILRLVFSPKIEQVKKIEKTTHQTWVGKLTSISFILTSMWSLRSWSWKHIETVLLETKFKISKAYACFSSSKKRFPGALLLVKATFPTLSTWKTSN